jgi:signal transduction histidine kinase
VKAHSESEEIVHAIRRGGVDALVVHGEQGEEVVVLQGAEHPYRLLVESFKDGAATLDSRGTILYLNDRFAEILGEPAPNLIGTSLLDHLPWRGREDLQQLLQRCAHGEVVLKTDRPPERAVRFTLGFKSLIGEHICLIATEITDLVKVTEALRASEQSLRELSARLLKLQDDERRQIARDLHDSTGQILGVQAMLLSNLLRREAPLDADVREVVAECANINEQVTQEIRTVSYLLHPPLLDELGLGSAVKWYVAGFESRSGICVSVEIDLNFPRLSADAEIALFRIVQESLTNVHRYSGASRGYIRLKRMESEIMLEIGDNGKGIQQRSATPSGKKVPFGVGIQGMTERVRQLSGRLEIKSQENQGTVITAILPFDEAQAASA